jgi:formylglycine-generating enzyme required for sulfatase activity
MGVEVDLPTDAQWEFAARAGTSQKYGVNGGTDNYGTTTAPIIWCSNTAPTRSYPQVPGLLKPNAWGLYDMNGDVWEWCLDQYDGTWNSETDNWYANAWNPTTETYNGVTVYVDPVGMLLNTGANTDKQRVLRGGSVDNGANNALSSYRHMRTYDSGANNNWSGFRLACPVPTL